MLHTRVGWDHVVSWAEILIDEPLHPHRQRYASPKDDGLKATLEEIVAMGRDLIRTITERPSFSIDETIAAIGRIVDVAAGAVEDEGMIRDKPARKCASARREQ